MSDKHVYIKCNLDSTKGQETGKICSLYQGFVISLYYYYYYRGKENCSLCQGLRYIEVRYIEVRYIEVRYIEIRYMEVRYIEVRYI